MGGFIKVIVLIDNLSFSEFETYILCKYMFYVIFDADYECIIEISLSGTCWAVRKRKLS